MSFQIVNVFNIKNENYHFRTVCRIGALCLLFTHMDVLNSEVGVAQIYKKAKFLISKRYKIYFLTLIFSMQSFWFYCEK